MPLFVAHKDEKNDEKLIAKILQRKLLDILKVTTKRCNNNNKYVLKRISNEEILAAMEKRFVPLTRKALCTIFLPLIIDQNLIKAENVQSLVLLIQARKWKRKKKRLGIGIAEVKMEWK